MANWTSRPIVALQPNTKGLILKFQAHGMHMIFQIDWPTRVHVNLLSLSELIAEGSSYIGLIETLAPNENTSLYSWGPSDLKKYRCM